MFDRGFDIAARSWHGVSDLAQQYHEGVSRMEGIHAVHNAQGIACLYARFAGLASITATNANQMKDWGYRAETCQNSSGGSQSV